MENVQLCQSIWLKPFIHAHLKLFINLMILMKKNLSELENRKDGKFEIIDVKLNNRKTKIVNKENPDISLHKSPTKNISDLSSIVNEKIASSNKSQNPNEFDRKVL